jgi:O-methyltransferase
MPRLAEIVATLAHRTYVSDGLITRHAADFLRDRKFVSAYAAGKATGSWMRMEPQWRVYTACWAAKQALSVPGDFVECGVNRGGMALTIMKYVDFESVKKRFFLVDTFAGFPSGSHPAAANRDMYSDCYADVVKTFEPYRNAIIVRGRVPDTLSAIDSRQIAYLSIDMNDPEPEAAAVRTLWPRMMPGGAMLLDDYGGGVAYRRQRESFDALANELGFQILALPTGQGLVIRSPPATDVK